MSGLTDSTCLLYADLIASLEIPNSFPISSQDILHSLKVFTFS
jgi:hypothetical protein